MLAIYKRELRSFFQNVIGWVFIAAIVFVAALFFRNYNIVYGLADDRYMLASLVMILVFSIPVLCMRTLTEDRKNKTDQLTITSPVSIGSIILGKYFALVTVMFFTTVVVGAFPILLSKYVTIDWGMNLLALFGFFMYGACCIAICLFISSFTESQIIAAITSIITSFVIYYMPGITSLLEDTQVDAIKKIVTVLNVFDLEDRYDVFLSGMLDLKVIIYYLSMIVVFVFLTVQSVQKRRYTTSVKNISMSAFSIVGIILVVGVAIGVNLAATKIPTKYSEFDLTKNSLYSISDTTKEVASALSEDVTIYVYAAEDNKDETIDRILSKYRSINKKISIVYIDPSLEENANFYEQYTDSEPSANSLFVVSEQRNKFISYYDMFITDYTVADDGSYQTTNTYDIEGQLTSALNYIEHGVTSKIYVLAGHSEYDLPSVFTDSIEKQNFDYESLTISEETPIPDDCNMLIINAPAYDLEETEVDAILEYAENGGKLLLAVPFADVMTDELPNYAKLLEYYNVYAEEGIIADSRSFSGSPLFIIPDSLENEVTEGVYGKKPIWLPESKALKVLDESNTDVTIDVWLKSTKNSFNLTDIYNLSEIKYTPGEDEVGPFDVALTATKKTSSGAESVAYIIGSTNAFEETVNTTTNNANLTVFTNIVTACSDESTKSVVVPPKTLDAERFIINNMSGVVMFLGLLIVLPLAFIIIGCVIWMRRRKK